MSERNERNSRLDAPVDATTVAARLRRPVAWSVVVCTALSAFVARPAYADPTPNVPDPGAPPIPSGSLPMPGGLTTPGLPRQPAAPVLGPLAKQIIAENAVVELLGEQLTQLNIDLDQAKRTTRSTEDAWQQAAHTLAELRRRADSAAEEAYKAAIALGPLGEYADDLHQLSILAPGLGEQPGGEALAREVAEAEQVERAAHSAYLTASAAEQATQDRWQVLKLSHDQHLATLLDLRTRNAAELARIEAEREAFEQSLATHIDVGGSVDGKVASEKALAAFRFALHQLGKWYEFGAEGPDTFDCSGLIWRAYQSVGVNIPRVSFDQAHALTSIPVNKLLVGDLLFFGNDRGDWRSVHHVGMYIGNGRMIHAPTWGTQVQISSIWWSEFWGAARPVPAVDAPKPTPSPSPSPSPPPATTSPTTPPPTEPPPTTPPAEPPPTTPPATPPPTEPPPTEPPPTTPPAEPPPTTPPAEPPASPSPDPSGSTGP